MSSLLRLVDGCEEDEEVPEETLALVRFLSTISLRSKSVLDLADGLAAVQCALSGAERVVAATHPKIEAFLSVLEEVNGVKVERMGDKGSEEHFDLIVASRCSVETLRRRLVICDEAYASSSPSDSRFETLCASTFSVCEKVDDRSSPVFRLAEPISTTSVVVMGVCGSGKSTVGASLGADSSNAFVEGDCLHPKGNIEKMKSGKSLTDDDRAQWLEACAEALVAQRGNVVLSCSALKARYRKYLADRFSRLSTNRRLFFLYLRAPDPRVIINRLNDRKGHFMPTSLVRTQFDVLEPPTYDEHAMKAATLVTIDATLPLATITDTIQAYL